MSEKRTPQWQPISNLGLIARLIDGMVESASEQFGNLNQARPKPHVLDDYTIERVIEVFNVQQKDLWLFEEQLNRWKGPALTIWQGQEVARLAGQLKRLKELISAILELAEELKGRTIEKQGTRIGNGG